MTVPAEDFTSYSLNCQVINICFHKVVGLDPSHFSFPYISTIHENVTELAVSSNYVFFYLSDRSDLIFTCNRRCEL